MWGTLYAHAGHCPKNHVFIVVNTSLMSFEFLTKFLRKDTVSLCPLLGGISFIHSEKRKQYFNKGTREL